MTTTIQLNVHDGMRGRVMSMLTVIFFGFATLGGVIAGTIGDRIGVPRALAAGGAGDGAGGRDPGASRARADAARRISVGHDEACEPRHLPWRRAHDIVKYLALNFFDAVLNDDPAALARLGPQATGGIEDLRLWRK